MGRNFGPRLIITPDKRRFRTALQRARDQNLLPLKAGRADVVSDAIHHDMLTSNTSRDWWFEVHLDEGGNAKCRPHDPEIILGETARHFSCADDRTGLDLQFHPQSVGKR